jgi:phosphopantothenoylcysteine decarboxylase
MSQLLKPRVVVGITGGIAAYKAATLVSKLVQRDCRVSVVLSHSAMHFVGAATFAALCNEQPVFDSFDSRFPLGPHIELADGCDLLVVAPATAKLMASCASGAASCLLSTLYLNVTCPVLFAPAMSTPMWEKPAVQRNVKQLKEDGVNFVGPASGWLSCRKVGEGRMVEAEDILATCLSFLVSSDG